MLGSAILAIEILFAHDQQKNAFDNPEDGGNSCPAKQQIKNTPANATKIEFTELWGAGLTYGHLRIIA
jgi:hypothetical protein